MKEFLQKHRKRIIAGAVVASDNETALNNLKERSLKLCKKYPLYEGMHV